jgi:RimJ/RimL family protein N-acetyltransferase
LTGPLAYVIAVPLHVLPDGREIAIRPIRADDGDRLRASHARLSPESRYRRFLAAKPELSSADARYLVEIDGSDHFALVATAPDQDGTPIVGVARYIRSPDDREAAEFAIVVADAYQGQGLGTELVARLGDAAVARGVRRFRATMLADNVAIHRLMERVAGGTLDERRFGEVSEVEVDLPARSDDIRSRSAAMIAACVGS